MIPFNQLYISGKESAYVNEAIAERELDSDGPFSKRCIQWLQLELDAEYAMLTPSCTASLEMAVLLAGVGPGDEVILPSYTFSSTATSVVAAGGIPVFVDIDFETGNVTYPSIVSAVTNKTKAIIVVHYAGTSCADMVLLRSFADEHGLVLIEDAAQAMMSTYQDRYLGTIGHIGCFSFHSTKNIICGEGGAILVNEPGMVERAKVLRDKGTNRANFIDGLVDKYTWVDKGGSYLPSELSAAFLLAQLEAAEEITESRKTICDFYRTQLTPLAEEKGIFIQPHGQGMNGHIFFMLLESNEKRKVFSAQLRELGVSAVPHYVPLHSSVAGKRYGRVVGAMSNTDAFSSRVIRLPVWPGVDRSQVVDAVKHIMAGIYRNI